MTNVRPRRPFGRPPVRPPRPTVPRPRPPAVAGPRFLYSLAYGPVPVHPATRADVPTLTLAQTAALAGPHWTPDTLAAFHRLVIWAVDDDVSADDLAAIVRGEGGDHV